MTETYSSDELAQIKALQRVAYDCVEEVAAGLTAGVTEREAAERVGAALRARGVEGFFHTPFAWFGDRAGFWGFRPPSWRRPLDNVAFARQFFPTDRRLEVGMSGILDAAPIRGGLCADIGYAFALGDNEDLAQARADLLEIRELVIEQVRAGRTMREIYRAVDAAIAELGYESAHALYPSRVLGHKIGRIPLAGLRSGMVAGFDARTYLYLGGLIVRSLPGLRRLPLWNESAFSDARPSPGLWAIEPHIRKPGFGAKWEEIMVVTDADAYWLDNDLPHVTAVPGRAVPLEAPAHADRPRPSRRVSPAPAAT
jgi:Xaa-Pro aminopeptidase